MKLTEMGITEKKENEEQDSFSESSEKQSTFKKFISNSFLHMAIKKGIFYFVVFFIALTLAFLIPRLVPGNIL